MFCIFQPGPRDGSIQCFIKRDKSALTYHLYLCLSPGKLTFLSVFFINAFILSFWTFSSSGHLFSWIWFMWMQDEVETKFLDSLRLEHYQWSYSKIYMFPWLIDSFSIGFLLIRSAFCSWYSILRLCLPGRMFSLLNLLFDF